MILIKEKYSRILRWSHWINFALLSLMVWSGILIYWANDAYIKIPNSVAEIFSIRHRLAEGMGWHFFIMWAFFFNGLVYVTYMFLSGEWKTLAPWARLGEFNPVQKLAYILVILMGVGSVVTGLAIYKPVTLGSLTNLLGGYKAARFEHFLLMIGFVLFFIVHIIQVARAGWNNFRAMVAGYEIEKD